VGGLWTAQSAELCSYLELLEPQREAVSIWPILISSWLLDQLPDDPREAEFEERLIIESRAAGQRRGCGNPDGFRLGERRRPRDAASSTVSGFETIGCSSCSSASMTMCAQKAVPESSSSLRQAIFEDALRGTRYCTFSHRNPGP
jgi:hypothetical protein